MFIDEIEHTGPVVRVWVVAEAIDHEGDEDPRDAARDLAHEAVGDVEGLTSDLIVHDDDRFEVVFEAGDLA